MPSLSGALETSLDGIEYAAGHKISYDFPAGRLEDMLCIEASSFGEVQHAKQLRG